MPASLREFANCEVEYEVFKGWTTDITTCRSFEELPTEAQARAIRSLLSLSTHACPL